MLRVSLVSPVLAVNLVDKARVFDFAGVLFKETPLILSDEKTESDDRESRLRQLKQELLKGLDPSKDFFKYNKQEQILYTMFQQPSNNPLVN